MNVSTFNLNAPFEPKGDQPKAIAELVTSIQAKNRFQTLLGATGTGKTFLSLLFLNKLVNQL